MEDGGNEFFFFFLDVEKILFGVYDLNYFFFSS